MKRFSKSNDINSSEDTFNIEDNKKVRKLAKVPIWYRVVCLGISLLLLLRLYFVLSNNSINNQLSAPLIDLNVMIYHYG